MSIDGLRQGDAPASVYFNILVARVYIKQLALLDGRGVLFAVSGDLRILAPPTAIREIEEVFPETAWEEASLTTQTKKDLRSALSTQWMAHAPGFYSPRSLSTPSNSLFPGRHHAGGRLGPRQLPAVAGRQRHQQHRHPPRLSGFYRVLPLWERGQVPCASEFYPGSGCRILPKGGRSYAHGRCEPEACLPAQISAEKPTSSTMDARDGRC